MCISYLQLALEFSTIFIKITITRMKTFIHFVELIVIVISILLKMILFYSTTTISDTVSESRENMISHR